MTNTHDMREMSFIVHGKVQGVWYRAWTRDTAKEMGVTGWVRNRPDGLVEGVAQGEDSLLKKFLDKLHDGPPLARVTDVEIEYASCEEIIAPFEVRK